MNKPIFKKLVYKDIKGHVPQILVQQNVWHLSCFYFSLFTSHHYHIFLIYYSFEPLILMGENQVLYLLQWQKVQPEIITDLLLC